MRSSDSLHVGDVLHLVVHILILVDCDCVESLLVNRHFYVEMDGRRSRWRIQRNGLPQGSVLAPLLFNIYTDDQPQFQNIRRFIYADDLCIATQSHSFTTIEERLSSVLESLSSYYKKCHLNAIPNKTQVCTFHLNNHQANRKLKIVWNNRELEHHPHPVYLGITLDRTLSFRDLINIGPEIEYDQCKMTFVFCNKPFYD